MPGAAVVVSRLTATAPGDDARRGHPGQVGFEARVRDEIDLGVVAGDADRRAEGLAEVAGRETGGGLVDGGFFVPALGVGEARLVVVRARAMPETSAAAIP